MKKWANLGRQPHEFKVGDVVLVKLQPALFQFFRYKVHKELMHKYKEHFPIINKVGSFFYNLHMTQKPIIQICKMLPKVF